MARLLRVLVTALLTVAVPFQGALAVNAAQCMALQAGQEAHEGHEHSHPQSPQSEQDHDKGAGSHCGPCTGCCASAAIAAPPRIVISLTAHDAVSPLPILRPLGDIPDGLDRPPLVR
jgi:hypothetical protein